MRTYLEDLDHLLTSSDPINGEIVSGSSGAIAPMSFQLFVRPSLIEFACSAEVVRLYKIAIEFASCGQSVVVSLSRYMPADGSQNASLKRVFNESALADQLDVRMESLTAEARSVPVVRTFRYREF